MSACTYMLVEFLLASKLRSVVTSHFLVNILCQILFLCKTSKPLYRPIYLAKICVLQAHKLSRRVYCWSKRGYIKRRDSFGFATD